MLVQVDADHFTPPRYSLYGIVLNEADSADVRRWLADVATRVRIELGVSDEIEAATTAGVSLELIETSYAADVTQITWRRSRPEPEGAH